MVAERLKEKGLGKSFSSFQQIEISVFKPKANYKQDRLMKD